MNCYQIDWRDKDGNCYISTVNASSPQAAIGKVIRGKKMADTFTLAVHLLARNKLWQDMPVIDNRRGHER